MLVLQRDSHASSNAKYCVCALQSISCSTGTICTLLQHKRRFFNPSLDWRHDNAIAACRWVMGAVLLHVLPLTRINVKFTAFTKLLAHGCHAE